ncbi:MAG: LPS export ABC transporter periplasmic protein LptC [Zetaproteobacteria bacterium]|nr:MAG: LPS export ABC transporter periplasmic protein LptC [Zetaproteobacteria bacterium]
MLAVVLVVTHEDALTPTGAPSGMKPKQEVEIENPVIVERKGPRIVWSLNASRARQLRNGHMLMMKPTLTLYTRHQKSIPIQGAVAEFDPKTKHVIFKRHVVMHYETWKLECAELIYDSMRDEASVPGSFVASNPSLTAKGKHLILRRDIERLWVKEGIWIKDRGLLGLEIKR